MKKEYILYFDSGTSNTRAYLLDREFRICDSAKRAVGSKDSAIAGTNRVLIEGMKALYDQVLAANSLTDGDVEAIYASGMVTSPYGLKEVPHLVLPMTVRDFADSLYPFHEDTCFHRDIFLVPGLKTLSDDFSFVNNLRGEEIEIIGALEELKAERDVENVVMLMPGSHTHGIYIQGDQITGIISNFTGELFYALKQDTILSPVLTSDSLELDEAMVRKGIEIWSASASTGPSTSATPCGSLNRELLSSVSPMERASSWAGCASLWSTTVSTSGRSAGRWPWCPMSLCTACSP